MQIDTLRYFVELARAGSFYGAAKNVFISQQGLSKAMGSLEAELGVKLLERENRGVRLTSSGEVLLEHAEKLLGEYSDTLKDLYAEHTFSSTEDNRLVIHMTYYPSQIADVFVKRMKAYGSLNLVEEPFQQVLEGARESDGSELFLVDLHGDHDRGAEFSDMVFEPVIATRAGLIWTDGAPIRARGAIHREQLADIPLSVDSHREMLRLLEYIMEDYPLNNIRVGVANPKGRIEYATAAGDIALLYDSLGYTLVQANRQLANKAMRFTPFSTPRSVSHIGFLYNKAARPNVRARHLIEAIKQHLRTNQAQYLKKYPLT